MFRPQSNVIPYDLAALTPVDPAFTTNEEAIARLDVLAQTTTADAHFEVVGTSEQGRVIAGLRVGSGSRRALLLAGHHADEPVGPQTLRTLGAALLSDPDTHADLLANWTLYLVPHANPDGEAANRAWIDAWPDAAAFVSNVEREAPGRDLEFSYPDGRQETAALSAWMRTHGPFDLYASLHGMAQSEGALLLIDRSWAGRSRALQQAFSESARDAGLGLHDHNRRGEKGFFYIAPGFTTTPEGLAMQRYFAHLGDWETAQRFRLSSMEFVQSLGGDPLCLVTELPLFLVSPDTGASPASAAAYVRFKSELPGLRSDLARADPSRLDAWNLRPLGLGAAMRVQLALLASALRFREDPLSS